MTVISPQTVMPATSTTYTMPPQAGPNVTVGPVGDLTEARTVTYNGVPIRYYDIYELRQMTLVQQRQYADLLFRTIGPDAIGSPVPVEDHLLIDWIRRVQTIHLYPILVHTVIYNGFPIRFYDIYVLKQIPPDQQRQHADYLFRTMGPRPIDSPVPVHDHSLPDWIIMVQTVHLQPLLVQYVVYNGVLIPVYEIYHLRHLKPVQQRHHAYLLFRVIGIVKIGSPVPVQDQLLVDWILRVQAAHLKPLLVTPAGVVPLAAVGVDANGDGRANYVVFGPDYNNTGIPDALNGRVTAQRIISGTPVAAPTTAAPRTFATASPVPAPNVAGTSPPVAPRTEAPRTYTTSPQVKSIDDVWLNGRPDYAN